MNLLLAPFRAIGALFGWIHKAFCALLDPEGRRAWAVVIAWGCSVAMTAYSGYALWLVRDHALLAFWMGSQANLIIFLVVSAITGLLIKREIGGSWSKDGGGNINVKDKDG